MSIKDLSNKLVDDMKTILEGGTVVVEDASNDKSDDGEGLDKADPKAAKKKFNDRKDKDIDNDGDVDSSDEFLHKRRKAISKKVDEDSSVEIDKDDEEDDDVVKKPEDDEKGKKLLKTGKGGKYLKYSNLLLKKQKMSKDADMTAINKEISAERKKLGISESTLEDLLIHYLPEDEEIEITEKMLYKSPTGWSFQKDDKDDAIILTQSKSSYYPRPFTKMTKEDFKVLQRIIGQVKV
tara:strand:+ start:1249 stop:1959 length:711 start_codon:yes stop_codon:yes gene_type:complete